MTKETKIEITDEQLFASYGRIMLDYQMIIERKQVIESEIARRRNAEISKSSLDGQVEAPVTE